MIIASLGGGDNSRAMLIRWVQEGRPLDLVLFADTGGELRQTYANVEAFSEWLVSHGAPGVVTVREPNETLEENCLRAKRLPSIAYGFKSCSDRWKRRPIHRYVKAYGGAELWARGEAVCKLVGFDADEQHRAVDPGDKRYNNRYPLIEWGMQREDCTALVEAEGMIPGKSSCFFCPAMKKHEIIALPPDLQARAIAMEENAELTTIKGLGRNFAWKALLSASAKQYRLFPDCGVSVCPNCMD